MSNLFLSIKRKNTIAFMGSMNTDHIKTPLHDRIFFSLEEYQKHLE